MYVVSEVNTACNLERERGQPTDSIEVSFATCVNMYDKWLLLFIQVTDELKSTRLFQEESRQHPDKVREVIREATQIAWKMVTLTPPAIVFQPHRYDPQWHEMEASRLTPQMCNKHFDLIYYRPILLFGADGQVACNGSVSKRAHAKGFNQPLAIIEDDAESSSTKKQEQNTCSQNQRKAKPSSAGTASAKATTTETCYKCGEGFTTAHKKIPVFSKTSMHTGYVHAECFTCAWQRCAKKHSNEGCIYYKNSLYCWYCFQYLCPTCDKMVYYNQKHTIIGQKYYHIHCKWWCCYDSWIIIRFSL